MGPLVEGIGTHNARQRWSRLKDPKGPAAVVSVVIHRCLLGLCLSRLPPNGHSSSQLWSGALGCLRPGPPVTASPDRTASDVGLYLGVSGLTAQSQHCVVVEEAACGGEHLYRAPLAHLQTSEEI